MTSAQLTFHPTIPPNVELGIVMKRLPPDAVPTPAAAEAARASCSVWGKGWADVPYLFSSAVGTYANSNRHWQFLAPRGAFGGIVELQGAVSRSSGIGYFEIEFPVACLQYNLGLLLSSVAPGDSVYDAASYRVLWFAGDNGALNTEAGSTAFACPSLGQMRVAGDRYGFKVDCDKGKILTVYFNGIALPINDAAFVTANTWTGGAAVWPWVNARDKPLRDSTCTDAVTHGDTDDDEGCSFRVLTALSDFRDPLPDGAEPWDTVGGGKPDPAKPAPGDYADEVYGGALDALVATDAQGAAWFALSARQYANHTFTIETDGADIGIYNREGVCWKSGASPLSANIDPARVILIAVGTTFGQDFAAAGDGGTVSITLS